MNRLPANNDIANSAFSDSVIRSDQIANSSNQAQAPATPPRGAASVNLQGESVLQPVPPNVVAAADAAGQGMRAVPVHNLMLTPLQVGDDNRENRIEPPPTPRRRTARRDALELAANEVLQLQQITDRAFFGAAEDNPTAPVGFALAPAWQNNGSAAARSLQAIFRQTAFPHVEWEELDVCRLTRSFTSGYEQRGYSMILGELSMREMLESADLNDKLMIVGRYVFNFDEVVEWGCQSQNPGLGLFNPLPPGLVRCPMTRDIIDLRTVDQMGVTPIDRNGQEIDSRSLVRPRSVDVASLRVLYGLEGNTV